MENSFPEVIVFMHWWFPRGTLLFWVGHPLSYNKSTKYQIITSTWTSCHLFHQWLKHLLAHNLTMLYRNWQGTLLFIGFIDHFIRELVCDYQIPHQHRLWYTHQVAMHIRFSLKQCLLLGSYLWWLALIPQIITQLGLEWSMKRHCHEMFPLLRR